MVVRGEVCNFSHKTPISVIHAISEYVYVNVESGLEFSLTS